MGTRPLPNGKTPPAASAPSVVQEGPGFRPARAGRYRADRRGPRGHAAPPERQDTPGRIGACRSGGAGLQTGPRRPLPRRPPWPRGHAAPPERQDTPGRIGAFCRSGKGPGFRPARAGRYRLDRRGPRRHAAPPERQDTPGRMGTRPLPNGKTPPAASAPSVVQEGPGFRPSRVGRYRADRRGPRRHAAPPERQHTPGRIGALCRSGGAGLQTGPRKPIPCRPPWAA